jgi:hypothetical protein
MRLLRLLPPGLLVALVGCGGSPGATPDALAAGDGGPLVDAVGVDAAVPGGDGGVPSAGFGAVSGMCGVLTPAELDGTTPRWFQGELTFATRYNDPADRPLLTPGGQVMVATPNAGGSSLFSEVFAYEWLARCEGAILLKTETGVSYDVVGKIADFLVEIDGRKVGVSVTRAVAFPFGQPYTMAAASSLLTGKLDDLRVATADVSAADRWTAQLVVVDAYDAQAAQVAMDAWVALPAATRGTTLLDVIVTSGDDLFIYTNM